MPFPYTDRNTRQHRPALAVSPGHIGENGALLWVVMITSAANRPWPEDVPLIDQYRQAGLPVPSIAKRIEFDTTSSPPTLFGIHVLSSRLLPCLKLNALGYIIRPVKIATIGARHADPIGSVNASVMRVLWKAR